MINLYITNLIRSNWRWVNRTWQAQCGIFNTHCEQTGIDQQLKNKVLFSPEGFFPDPDVSTNHCWRSSWGTPRQHGCVSPWPSSGSGRRTRFNNTVRALMKHVLCANRLPPFSPAHKPLSTPRPLAHPLHRQPVSKATSEPLRLFKCQDKFWFTFHLRSSLLFLRIHSFTNSSPHLPVSLCDQTWWSNWYSAVSSETNLTDKMVETDKNWQSCHSLPSPQSRPCAVKKLDREHLQIALVDEYNWNSNYTKNVCYFHQNDLCRDKAELKHRKTLRSKSVINKTTLFSRYYMSKWNNSCYITEAGF